MPGIRKKSIILVLLFWLPVVQADQNNPQIDTLMQALQQTSDVKEGTTITRKIWKNWFQTDNQEAQRLLLQGEKNMRVVIIHGRLIIFQS